MIKKYILFLTVFLCTVASSFGQLNIASTGTNYTINFDATVTGVNNGGFTGSGWQANPIVGRLDSDAWEYAGMSDSPLSFGGVALGGDAARGNSDFSVTSGGWYAFNNPNTNGGVALGCQPTGGDWTSGTITLRLQNTTGTVLTILDLDYDILCYNDQGRSNTFNFSHSSDNTTYTTEASLNYSSPTTATSTGGTPITTPKSISITGLSIANNAYYYLRWKGDDNGGSGSRDEFAIDNIVINAPTGTPTCSISDISVSATSGCNDNGTTTNAADDYYIADVVVTYTNPPASGTINLTGSGVVGGTTSIVITTSPQTISGVRLAANGSNVQIIATFSAETTCNYTETVGGSGMASCSSASCTLTSSGIINTSCNDNSTTSDATDDYITFDLNPTGGSLGATYSVAVSSGTITPNSGINYGSASTFTLQNGSAGLGDVTVTITDVSTNCSANQIITDPGSCSSVGGSVCLSDDFNSGYGNWNGGGSGTYQNPTAGITGNGTGFNATNEDIITTSALTNPQTLTLWLARSGSTANKTLSIQYATSNTGPWTSVRDILVSEVTTTHQEFTIPLNLTGNYYLRIVMTQRSGGSYYLDDVEVSCGICSTPDDASSFTATNSCGDINLTWTAPSCGEEVIIVARANTAVAAGAPSGDGSTYTADANFSGAGTNLLFGKVVYKGTGTSETITGLTNGVTYHFKIFTRVGTTWSSGVTDSVVASVATNNVPLFTTYNSCGDISLNWSLPVCFNDVLIVARANNPVAAGTPSGNGSTYTADANFSGTGSNLLSGKVVYKSTGTSETITGLTNGVTYHFKIFTRIGTTWSSGVIASATSISSSTSGPTTFIPGDLVFVGFDSYIGGPNDKYSILNMVDIGPNTEFTMANLLYEWNENALGTSGKWYNCANNFDDDPSYATIRYIGCADIPKGSIICLQTSGSGAIFNITVNGVSASSDFTIIDNADPSDTNAGNISTTNPDAIWLMQGAFSAVNTESDGSDTGGAADKFRTFSGTVLGGLQTKGNFQLFSVAGNAGGNRISRIHPDIECVYLETGPTSNTYFYGYHNSMVSGTHYALLANITDVASNWVLQSGDSSDSIQPLDNISSKCGSSYTITGSANVAGHWIGSVSTDWFDCKNWENFSVPKRNTNVTIDATSTDNCNIDHTSPNAFKYGYVADCNNIIISDYDLIIDSDLDILYVYDVTIQGSGILDMDDGNSSTDDGLINFYGNWTNTAGESAFIEGNGMVNFTGDPMDGPQVINSNVPANTEQFYNVTINNNFDTSTSNNLYANGSVIVNSGNTVTVTDGRYVYANLDFTNNGVFNIDNNGSLVQGDDTGINTGNISMERSASIDAQDYVYWSSPITGFNVNNVSPSSPTNRIYKWNPTFANTNGSFGNWVSATGETMQEGIGYIIRVPNGQAPPPSPGDLNFTATFNNGVPHNGLVTPAVSHGGNSGSDDDDWNLLGNPYPSAIDAYTFLSQSPNDVLLDGFVNLWTHGNAPSTATSDPFYYDFGSNYTAADYITYNVLGGSYGPGDILIAAGQSFMVNMLDTAPTSGNIVFNNAMRDRSYDNSLFYKSSGSNKNNFRTIEKHRFWLDLVSDNQPTNRILIGYSQNATQERDRLFDAISDNQNFYSLIENEQFVIQGRTLPFNDSDIVPLGFKCVSQGSYHIAIAAVDGLFELNNQTIYLKDNALNFIHNLTLSPYSFASDIGTFNDRFELIYRNASLSVDDNTILSNDITIIELNNNDVKFSLGNSSNTIQEIEIFDVLGRTLYRLEGDSSSEIYNLSSLSQSTYFARITLSNGQVITKKAIKRK